VIEIYKVDGEKTPKRQNLKVFGFSFSEKINVAVLNFAIHC